AALTMGGRGTSGAARWRWRPPSRPPTRIVRNDARGTPGTSSGRDAESNDPIHLGTPEGRITVQRPIEDIMDDASRALPILADATAIVAVDSLGLDYGQALAHRKYSTPAIGEFPDLDAASLPLPVPEFPAVAQLPLAACRRENFSSRSTPFLTQNLIVSVINWS
ncbi:MAG: hypothetical protein ACYDEO_25225, partial [Aggregatilineales bacterium]